MLVLILVASLSYFKSDRIVEWLAIYKLEELGASNLHIQSGRPTLQGITIHKLESVWPEFQLNLTNMQITYTLTELLSGQLQSIIIERASVISSEDAQASTSLNDTSLESMEVPAVLFTWPGLLPESLPRSIEVSELLYTDPENRLQARVHYLDKRLVALGELRSTQFDSSRKFEAELAEDGAMEFTLFQDNATSRLLHLSTQTSAIHTSAQSSASIKGTLQLSSDAMQEALDLFAPDTGTLGIVDELVLDFDLTATWQTQSTIALGEMQISGQFGSKLYLTPFMAEIETVALRWEAPGTIALSHDKLSISPGPQIHISGPAINAQFGLAKIEAELEDFTTLVGTQVSLLPGARMDIFRLIDDQASDIQLPKLELRTSANLDLSINHVDQSVELGAVLSYLDIPRLIYLEQAYKIQTLHIQTPKIIYKPDEALKFSINLANASKALNVDAGFVFDAGQITSTSRIQLKSRSSLFKELIKGWAHDVDAFGSLNIDITAALDADTATISKLSGQLTLQNSSLLSGNFAASGLNLSAPFHYIDTRFETDIVQINIREANVGLELTNIQGSVQYKNSQLRFEPFKSGFLGGEATSEAFIYTLDTPKTEARLNFSNIELSRLVALADDEISASGIIDGSVRLSALFNEDGSTDFIIDQGSLNARVPGGLIQYKIGAQSLSLAKQSDFDFALSALENFRYEKLVSSIALDKAGELKLGVSLLGSNPQIKKGRQIQYNLNIDQNLFALLHSLQLSNKLSERLGEKLSN